MKKERPLISIISPEYSGEKMVAELVRRIVDSVITITNNYEIILINDASPDNTWEAIVTECTKNPKVKGLNLSRNFGQHYAITAGLAYAKGDWVVVMDCDLQDRPEDIPILYQKAQEGYDIVYARRIVKQVSWLKKQSSILFHKVFDWLAGTHSDSTIGNFGIYSQQVIFEFNRMPEKIRFFPTLVDYLGFKKGSVNVQQDERAVGISSYNLSRLLKLSFNTIISNSNKPLKIAIQLGFIMAAISFLLAIYNLIAKWVGVVVVDGFTTTVFSIWFVGGLLLTMMGVLGLYIGKIFDQVKGRQIYIIKDKLNIDESN